MKLLEDMKAAILAGDWTSVCKAYNKITGEDIQPPIQIKVFDSKTAKKKELYEWLTKRRQMDEYKKYSTADLRDLTETFEALESMAGIELTNPSPSISCLSVATAEESPRYSQASDNSPFYVSGQDITVADKKLAEASLRIPDSVQKQLGVDDPNAFTPQPSLRPKFEMVDAVCLYCKASCKARPESVSNVTGVESTTCETCMATRRA